MSGHVRHPAPVNQFYRLDRATPTSPYTKTTRWNHIHTNSKGQLVNWDGLLCMASEGAVLLDAHTDGAHHYSPGQIHDHQHDNLGGIGVNDVAVAALSLGGWTIPTPAAYNRYDVLNAVRARRHVAIGVDYNVVPYAYQLQHPGDFDNALGIDDIRDSDGWLYVYDSLGTNPRWMPQSAVFPAAEALALRVRGTKQSLFVAVSKARAALVVPTAYRAVIYPAAGYKVREFAVYTVSGSKIVHRDWETTAGSSYDCTSPTTLLWPSHNPPTSIKVVKLKSGQYAEKYVSASFARAI
jgi:hypothetical protein